MSRNSGNLFARPVATLAAVLLVASAASVTPAAVTWGARAEASASDQFGNPPLLNEYNVEGGKGVTSAFVTAADSAMRPDGSVLSANALGRASLATGKVGVYATGAGGGTGAAGAWIDETINLSGGPSTGTIPVRITGLLAGTNPLINNHRGNGHYKLFIGPPDFQDEYVQLNFFLFSYGDEVNQPIDVTFDVPASNPAYRIYSSFEFVNADDEAYVSFENSASITSMTFPDGITATSASGVFLSAVPEPAGLSLVAAASLCLLGRPRRGPSPRSLAP